VKAKVIRQAFKEYAEGRHSIYTMSQRLYLLGLVGKTGKPLTKSSVIKILTNSTYIGLIKHKGEIYEGKFEPIVDKETFNAVQEEIKSKAKPRLRKHGKDFAFTGLIKCGECGGMITAQYAKKGKYIYYRCSKRMGVNCSQPYVQDVVLLGQLQAKLSKIALPKSWSEIALSHLEQRQREEVREQQSFRQNLEKQIIETEGKIDRLVNNFLDEMIEQDLYLKKKEELLKTKVELQEKVKNFGKKGVVWFELSKNCIRAAHQAETLASTNDLFEIKSFIKKFGSNRQLIQKKVQIDFEKPLDLVSKYKALARAEQKNIKRDEEEKMLVVSSSRGERTRTSDPHVPNVVR
jgi:site-specific DNA recombinase